MTLDLLKGAELSSVVFIRDYIQLIFEDERYSYTLTVFTLPKVYLNNTTFEFGSNGYCDSMCKLINRRIIKATDKENESITLVFEKEDCILISLKDEDYTGPEAAMLAHDDITIVW